MLLSAKEVIISLIINSIFCVSTFEEYANIIEDEIEIDDVNLRSNAYRIPGTLWCGAGSIAKHHDQLGKFRSVDICCRAHDKCDSMERGEQKYGLKNSFMISKLHCRCDKEFRDCLQKIGSKLANTIGRIYFSIQDRCYKEAHPIVGCERKAKSLMRSRCSHYKTDRSQPAKYQWFDLPFYFDPIECDAFKEQY